MKKTFAIGTLAVVLSTGLVIAGGGQAQDAERLLKAAINTEMVDGNLNAAIEQYKKVAASGNRVLAAQALVRMADCYQKLGDAQARAIYERIVRDYSDQAEPVAKARARLAAATPMASRANRAVWAGPKVEAGRVSADGRFISYTDWDNYNNLALHDLTTHTDRLLTSNKGFSGQDYGGESAGSVMSPDGKQVAYGWLQANNDRSPEIRVVSVLGSATRPPQTLVRFSREDVRYSYVRDWSPDGKLLAVVTTRTDGSSQIVMVTVADGSTRVLKTTDWRGAGHLFFSTDSKYIAFDLPANDDVDQRDVFVLAVDGGREVHAVDSPLDDLVAGWSPDGKYLLFAGDRTQSRSLWALPFASGKPQGQATILQRDIGSSLSLGIANGGSLYLFKDTSTSDVKVARIDLNVGALVGQHHHFSQGLLLAPFGPQWSPDGKYLVYSMYDYDSGNTIGIRTVATGEARRLPRSLSDPRWSPNGRSLIGRGRDSKGRIGIFQIDLETGAPVDAIYGAFRNAIWSPDGTKIYYWDERRKTIQERDVRSHVEREVSATPFVLGGQLEVSPDGRYLAMWTRVDESSKASSVLFVPVEGGPVRELLQVTASDMVGNGINSSPTMAWTPDSRALVMARKSGGVSQLGLLEIQTGRAQTLNIDVGGWNLTRGFSLSPDGRSIAFTMGKDAHEVWAMENFLPAQTMNR